jgi:uncharacterized protein YkwD
MKIQKALARLSIAACLCLAPGLSTAHAAAKSVVGKQTSMPPSKPGGKPITVAVFNYYPNPATPYLVDANGVLQPFPGVSSIPAGAAPFSLTTTAGTTVFYRRQRGGGKWVHYAGANPASKTTILGNAPGAPPAAPTSNTPSLGTSTPAPAAPPTIVNNKSVVNKTVVNNPPPGRKRGPGAPDINVTINPPSPSDTPIAPSTPPADAPPAGAPPATAPTTPAAGDQEGEFTTLTADDPRVVEFLRIHNAARADVGVPALEWSDDLAFTAQHWADHIGQTGRILHRPNSQYGENIGWGTGSYTPASAANAWLAEKAKYSPDTEAKLPTKKGRSAVASKATAAAETGHYTQMVWSKSTMVGFGIATTKDGKFVVVANYNPRGNIEGEKPYGQ